MQGRPGFSLANGWFGFMTLNGGSSVSLRDSLIRLPLVGSLIQQFLSPKLLLLISTLNQNHRRPLRKFPGSGWRSFPLRLPNGIPFRQVLAVFRFVLLASYAPNSTVGGLCSITNLQNEQTTDAAIQPHRSEYLRSLPTLKGFK
jgi:hypothetical protein